MFRDYTLTLPKDNHPPTTTTKLSFTTNQPLALRAHEVYHHHHQQQKTQTNTQTKNIQIKKRRSVISFEEQWINWLFDRAPQHDVFLRISQNFVTKLSEDYQQKIPFVQHSHHRGACYQQKIPFVQHSHHRGACSQ
jgi:hypothetical protein